MAVDSIVAHNPLNTGVPVQGQRLFFSRGDHLFSITSESLRQVVFLKSLRPLPGVESGYLGLSSWGGEIFTVWDPLSVTSSESPGGLPEVGLIYAGASVCEFMIAADSIEKALPAGRMLSEVVAFPPALLMGMPAGEGDSVLRYFRE